MKKIIFLIALLATASEAPAQKFSQLLESLVNSSPELKAMDMEHQAEAEEMAQENTLSGPELEGFHKWGTEGDTKYGVGISQGFDWPGLYRARSAARKANDNALAQLRLSTRADRMLELKQLMIQLITTREQLRLVNEANQNMKRLLELYQRGYEAGEESILDVNKLKIEGVRLSRRATALQDEADGVLQSIAAIAGSNAMASELNSLTISDLPSDPILSEADAEQQIDRSPAMQYQRAMQEATRQSERVARLQGFPTFAIGYELEREDGQYFNGISVNIGLPSWSNKHRKASARYRMLEQEVKMDAARLGEVLKMRRLRAAALRARSDEQLLSTVLQTTNQAELLGKALKGGQISLLTYLQELGYFLDATCDYYDTLNNAAQLCAELNKYNL